MHRRKFLATIGATAAAGCTAGTTPTDEASTTAPPTQAPTTAPATADGPADPRTAEPESTPTRGEVLVGRGRANLRAAIAAFVEESGETDPTILDVTAATSEFSRYDLDEANRAARADLNEALEHAEGAVAEEAHALLRVVDFLDVLGLTQIQLVNSYDQLDVLTRSFYTENYGRLDDDVDEIGYQRDLAAEHAASIDGSFEASMFAAVEAISGEHFEAKVAQIDAEIATFEGIVASLDGIAAPMESFEEDVGSYRTGQYDGVAFASGDFEDVRDGLAAIEPAESLRPVVEELACVFEALAGGTDVMQRAVLAHQNDDVETAREHESEAKSEFESCEKLVGAVEPVSDLVDSL